jgi:hypothetical protein
LATVAVAARFHHRTANWPPMVDRTTAVSGHVSGRGASGRGTAGALARSNVTAPIMPGRSSPLAVAQAHFHVEHAALRISRGAMAVTGPAKVAVPAASTFTSIASPSATA